MVNILFLNPAACVGGAEKSLMDLAERLPREKFQPVVAVLGSGPLIGELEKRGVECAQVPLPSALARLSRGKSKNRFLNLLAAPLLVIPLLVRLGRMIRSHKVDIIHSNGIKAHLIGCLLAAATGRTLIWHFRDVLEGGRYRRLFRLLGRLFPKRIIANSRHVKECLGELEKIKVVYNGIDLEIFAEREGDSSRRKEFGISPSALVVGTVGHFAPLKGYDDFVRSVPLVLKEVPGAVFLIVGEAVYQAYLSYKEDILRMVERLGLSDKVICPGYREDLSEILSEIDIFALPSRSEGFGRGNLEAMAVGKPVVSTRVGGVPEVVVDGETGYLVPPRDPEALARAVVKLARNEKLRDEMGRAGRRRAQLFSVQEMVKGVLEVYNEVLQS